MHYVMHDIAQAVTSGECLRTAGIGLISIAKTVRHLSIKIEGFSSFEGVVSINCTVWLSNLLDMTTV